MNINNYYTPQHLNALSNYYAEQGIIQEQSTLELALRMDFDAEMKAMYAEEQRQLYMEGASEYE